MSLAETVTIGQYYPAKSLLHRLDPRPKLIFVLIYVLVIFLANDLWSMVWMAAVLGGLIQLSMVPIRYMLKNIRPFLLILLFIVIMHLLFTREGEILLSWRWLTIYQGGLTQALLISFRLLMLILASALLTYTTRPMDMTDGIERLTKPFQKLGIPTQELALTMSIALRFIPTLMEEADKIIKAQMARGADFESRHLGRRFKSLLPLLIPLFVNSFQRAEELALAMEARGYHPGVTRTRFRQLQMNRRDWVAFSLILPVVGVLLFIRTWS